MAQVVNHVVTALTRTDTATKVFDGRPVLDVDSHDTAVDEVSQLCDQGPALLVMVERYVLLTGLRRVRVRQNEKHVEGWRDRVEAKWVAAVSGRPDEVSIRRKDQRPFGVVGVAEQLPRQG